MSWIWLDEVRSFERARHVQAVKRWQSFFPKVYLVEMMAQAGAILLGAESDFQNDVLFSKIEKMEFLETPEPDEEIEIHVKVDALRPEAGWFHGEIEQNRKKIARGRVLLVNVGRLLPGRREPITFPSFLLEKIRNAEKVTT